MEPNASRPRRVACVIYSRYSFKICKIRLRKAYFTIDNI